MKKMKRVTAALILAAIMMLSFSGCSVLSDNPAGTTGTTSAGGAVYTTPDGELVTAQPAEIPEANYDVDAVAGEDYTDADTEIKLNGDSISVTGLGAVADGQTVTISKQGTYVISGKLNDGQIIVNTEDSEKVKLILNGVDINCSYSAPVYVISAPKKVILYTQKDSVNIIKDNTSYNVDTTDSDAPTAAIFSMEDLKFDGEGELYVTGNYNKGIMSKDDIEIAGGTLYLKSVDDGIRGKDSVEMSGGYVSIDAGADGLRSSNDSDAEKGYIIISDGELYIEAEQDGIQAEASLTVSGGKITISCGGGSVNSSSASSGGSMGRQPGVWGQWGGGNMPGGGRGEQGSTFNSSTDTTSAKALKAAVSVTISGGSISVDSSDDAIHTNGVMTISGGSMYISTGDDGAHADDTLTISGGVIEIAKSYEGIEAETINIEGGSINITASDDGVNAAGGNDSSSMGGRPGQNGFFGGGASGTGKINITGGNVIVNASGDGLDANGSIAMSGGTAVVYGPTDNGNGSLDFDGSFVMRGGTLLAIGSNGMLQKPTGNGQKVMSVNCSISAGKTVCIMNASGETVACFETKKQIASIVYCAPELASGTYAVYTGGSYSTGSADGLLSGGEYTGGSKLTTVTIY